MVKIADEMLTQADSLNHCPGCGNDLGAEESVIREYVNKDGDSSDDSVFASGHYDENGDFESDRFDGFGGGRFDLRDDSDVCANCNRSL